MARKQSKSKNGIVGIATSLIILLILGGFLLAWAKANNINSFSDVITYAKAWSDKFDEKVHECFDDQGNYVDCGSVGGTETSTISPVDGGETSVDTILGKLYDIPVHDALELNCEGEDCTPENRKYDRAEWKHWTGNPCDTREELLIRDGVNVKKDDATCKILSGTWVSPYDNLEYSNPSKLDVDHVIPLSYAAKHGGQAWDSAKKEAFANDPNHLLAVTAKENRSKGDKGPSEYMPPLESYHCEYSTIWVNTASTYGISLTQDDVRVLEKGLQSCN